MKARAPVASCVAIMFAVVGHVLAAGPYGQSPATASPSVSRAAPFDGAQAAPSSSRGAQPRALLDQYCVTCHSDRLKTAQLSLEKLDLATVGEHAELWEKVVRKLRAGVMPPPDVRRPSLAEYEGLRDY